MERDLYDFEARFRQVNIIRRDYKYDTKGAGALAYSLLKPGECFAFVGGAFEKDTETPYKGIILTPVGCYKFDSGSSAPSYISLQDAKRIFKSWRTLKYHPVLYSFNELIEVLNRGPATVLEETMVKGHKALMGAKVLLSEFR